MTLSAKRGTCGLVVFASLAATACCTLPLMAQTTGVITGTITDSTGAVVLNAKVTVRNTGTGEARSVLSNANGFYVAYSLPVGVYEVEAAATGFKRTSRSNIQLDVADRLAINLTLEIGEVNESVSVTGEAPVLETENGLKVCGAWKSTDGD